MLATKPPRCKFCRERTSRVNELLHQECVAPWLAQHQEKKRKKQQAAAKAQAREERAVTKQRKEKAKTTTEWEDECRKIVQKIARLRDRNDGCISCDKPATWQGQWHGSHYRSHGAASAVQFHLWNINKACWICNKLYSGRIDQYEPRLIAKIGQDKVDWLKAQNQIVRHDVGYYKRFKAVMSKKLRRMEKRIGATPPSGEVM